MIVNALNRRDTSGLSELLIKDGKFVPASFEDINKFDQEQISLFCVEQGLYQIPTIELIEFLKEETKGGFTLEIGAGNGCIGRNVGCMMTDNFQQTWPEIKIYYEITKQPVVKYGDDVLCINGNEAIKKFNPHNVIACWVTELYRDDINEGNATGVNEVQMFADGILKYIHVGNDLTHERKLLFKKYEHKKYYFPWLLSRSMTREKNCIYIFKQ